MTGGVGGLEGRGDSGGELGRTVGPVGSDGTYVGMTWGEWLRITSEFCRREQDHLGEWRKRACSGMLSEHSYFEYWV